jgi:hypothetical protein
VSDSHHIVMSALGKTEARFKSAVNPCCKIMDGGNRLCTGRSKQQFLIDSNNRLWPDRDEVEINSKISRNKTLLGL